MRIKISCAGKNAAGYFARAHEKRRHNEKVRKSGSRGGASEKRNLHRNFSRKNKQDYKSGNNYLNI